MLAPSNKPKRVQIYYEHKWVRVNEMSTISERLREERKRLGLSQGEFADLLGIHRNTQARYERGEREPDTAYLDAIRKAGVDVGYVVGYSLPTPAEKLNDFHASLKIGSTSEQARDIFGQVIPGIEAQFDGGEAGGLILAALRVPYDEWNRIVEKLVRLNESGIPCSDSRDPAWARELAKASGLIRTMIEDAASLDSGVLAAVIEGVECAQLSYRSMIPAHKKAQAITMLYRTFKASGKVDQAMIGEVVKLAAA